MKPDPLRLSANQKKKLFDFIKNTKKRGIQTSDGCKTEDGRNVSGIRSKRKNAGRIPKISSEKNQQKIKQIVMDSPRSFGYLRNTWSIRLLAAYLTNILEMNVSPMQTWRIIRELGITYKKPKLMLEHEKDYEEKKKTIDNYKKVSSALLKKDTTRV